MSRPMCVNLVHEHFVHASLTGFSSIAEKIHHIRINPSAVHILLVLVNWLFSLK